MHKIYVLGLCDHIQLKTVNIMHVCIADQFLIMKRNIVSTILALSVVAFLTPSPNQK